MTNWIYIYVIYTNAWLVACPTDIDGAKNHRYAMNKIGGWSANSSSINA